MTREWRDQGGNNIGAGKVGGGPAGGANGLDVLGPGKQTLTGALQLRDDDGSGGGSGGGGSGSGSGGAPPPPQQKQQDMVSLVVQADGQYVQVYISPGGIVGKPDVFMFFHGHHANLKIDPKMEHDDQDNISGSDSAAAAVQQAKAKNTIVLLPQGIRGDDSNSGGQMNALVGKGNLPKFVDDILAAVGKAQGIKDPIVPNNIALAAHSGGGYEGVHEALTTAGKYADTITYLTLMDTNYSPIHFADAQAWMFKGSPNKTIRIVQGKGQIEHNYRWKPDPKFPDDKTKRTREQIDPYWRAYFGDAELKKAVVDHNALKANAGHPMSFNPIQKFDPNSTDDRGNDTRVLQHSQVMAADGKVQCDILIMQSAAKPPDKTTHVQHHEIRDNVMDDAIDSIGKGAAGADDFGKNHIENYGRDPKAPHAGDDLTPVAGDPVSVPGRAP